MISCLTALRGLGSPSVPGFVVLLAPLQPSSCGFSGSRWVDILVPRVVMGASLVISLCCVLCRLLPWELLQGFWCRHDRRDAPWGLRHSSLRSWGLLRVLLLRCVACLRGSACWHAASLSHPTVASTLTPGLRVSACLRMECLCLHTKDPVAHGLIRRCVLHFLCPCFDFVLLQTRRPCLRVLNPWSFQRVFNVSRFPVWLRAKHTCTCDGFSLDSSCLGQVASTVLELSSS